MIFREKICSKKMEFQAWKVNDRLTELYYMIGKQVIKVASEKHLKAEGENVLMGIVQLQDHLTKPEFKECVFGSVVCKHVE